MAFEKGIAQTLDKRQNYPCLSSPAKINLGLRIVGRRDDGYHLLESLFWPLDFADSLALGEGSELKVTARWRAGAPRPTPAIPEGRENLVYRAAERVGEAAARLCIDVEKGIPLGAGLGGGSSNAGTLLRHFVTSGHLGPEAAERHALALGADVPFFLDPRPTWVEGIGEKRREVKVEAAVLRDLRFLLVLPPESTPTPVIFSRYRALRVPFARHTPFATDRPLTWVTLENYLRGAENSLQGVAALEYPLLADILSQLTKTGPLHAALSGTGSTCFAVYKTPQAAEIASQVLQPFCRKNDCKSILSGTFVGA